MRRPRGGRWTMVAVALGIIWLCMAGALAYSWTQPRVYGATADILLVARPELSDAAVDRALQTQEMVIVSPVVLQPVATDTRIPLAQLQRDVSAGIVGRSNVLRLSVRDRDPRRAVTVARLVTGEYITTPSGAATQSANDAPPPTRSTLLSAARPLDHAVQPQPLRAVAAAAIVGLLVAVVVLTVLVRPRVLARPAAYWT
jgi:capsular polysaccharide biosynthesis protein